MMYFGGLQIVILEYIKRIHLRPSYKMLVKFNVLSANFKF